VKRSYESSRAAPRRWRRWAWVGLLAVAAGAGCKDRQGRQGRQGERTDQALGVVVMDPLAAPLACACVKGYAQRRYDLLGEFLQRRLGRPVAVLFTENLAEALKINRGRVDLIIGQRGLVLSDARRTGAAVRAVAVLTDPQGRSDLTGLFVVRSGDPARSLRDLAGRTIVFGPEDRPERHEAAVAALRAAGVDVPAPLQLRPSSNAAALAVAEGEADAAVISSYALPLLEGCGAIDRGALRVLARTAAVPFVTVFVTGSVSVEEERRILAALGSVREDPELLEKMESKAGSVALPQEPEIRAAAAPGSEAGERR